LEEDKNMEKIYMVVGVEMIGEKIVLKLKEAEVEEKLEPTKILTNIGGFIEKLKEKAVLSKETDKLTIETNDFNKLDFDLGDPVRIKIEKIDGG